MSTREATVGQHIRKDIPSKVWPVTKPAIITANGHLPRKYLKVPQQTTLWTSTFSKNKSTRTHTRGYKVHTVWKDFSTFSTIQDPQAFSCQISKRLGGYTQWVHFFLQKAYIISNIILRKKPFQGFSSKGPGTPTCSIKTRVQRNKMTFEFSHETLRGSSIRDQRGSHRYYNRQVGPRLARYKDEKDSEMINDDSG